MPGKSVNVPTFAAEGCAAELLLLSAGQQSIKISCAGRSAANTQQRCAAVIQRRWDRRTDDTATAQRTWRLETCVWESGGVASQGQWKVVFR